MYSRGSMRRSAPLRTEADITDSQEDTMDCKELDFELEVITLEYEDGSSEDCMVSALYEIGGKKYLSVVIGADETTDFEQDDLEGYIYLYEDTGSGAELVDIESDEEFNRIADIIKAYEEAREG